MLVIAPIRFCWVGLDGRERLKCGHRILAGLIQTTVDKLKVHNPPCTPRVDICKLVGRNFARIRQRKDLTQEQVEERSGFGQQYLSGLERGCRNPTVVTLLELARALGVSHMELVKPDDANEG